jgi:hypothetical protein
MAPMVSGEAPKRSSKKYETSAFAIMPPPKASTVKSPESLRIG